MWCLQIMCWIRRPRVQIWVHISSWKLQCMIWLWTLFLFLWKGNWTHTHKRVSPTNACNSKAWNDKNETTNAHVIFYSFLVALMSSPHTFNIYNMLYPSPLVGLSNFIHVLFNKILDSSFINKKNQCWAIYTLLPVLSDW